MVSGNKLDGAGTARIMYGESGMSEVNNMALWDKVCRTDPSHTKKVNQRGGFTAIDAMYQIESATKVFGAVGIGWGWWFQEPLFPGNGTVAIKCILWHGQHNQTVEHFGQKSLGSKDRADEDAFKKAATDGLTKCLSYLGFNADVFLGKFDDNKYVEALIAEKKALTPEQKLEAANKKAQVIIAEYKACKDLSALADVQAKYHSELKRFSEGYEGIFAMINTVGLQVIASFDQ